MRSHRRYAGCTQASAPALISLLFQPFSSFQPAYRQYLKLVWKDLEGVVGSREFETAASAMQEIAHSAAVSGGWQFSDQSGVLAADKFSNADIRVIGGIVGLFARATAQVGCLRD